MGFGGEMDLGGRGWAAVEMVLLVRVVDTVREDFWGEVVDDVMIFLGDDTAVEGSLGVNEVIPASEALGGLKDSLEGFFGKEFRGTERSTEVDTDSEHLADGG